VDAFLLLLLEVLPALKPMEDGVEDEEVEDVDVCRIASVGEEYLVRKDIDRISPQVEEKEVFSLVFSNGLSFCDLLESVLEPYLFPDFRKEATDRDNACRSTM